MASTVTDHSVQMISNQPGLVDTSHKKIVTQSHQNLPPIHQHTVSSSQPVVTRKITRKLIPLDDEGQEVQFQEPQNYLPPPQPVVQPVQQMIWPVAVQFNEDDALSKIREEKVLGLLERQTELLSNLLGKYRRIEEEQNTKLKRRIKELERENEDIWQKRRQNFLVYNVAQSVDQRIKEFNDFQLKPWMEQGQPILLKPMHLDDKNFFDQKKKKKKKKVKKVVNDGLVQDPLTGELWDPKTGQVVNNSQIN